MTRFEDQLFDDLMRDHGQALAHARPPGARKRYVTARRTMLAAGAGCAAVGAIAGTLVAGGGAAPAYAVTRNPDGTLTLAVYAKSGIVGANSRLHDLGDNQVVIVPVGPGCPPMSSLPAPAVPLNGHLSVQASSDSKDRSVTVNAQGIPAGDILVVAVESTTNGSETSTLGASRLTSPPAPACVSLPAAQPLPPGGTGSRHGSGVSVSANG